MPNLEAISVTDYLRTAHHEIVRRETYPFGCGVVAIDIAKILLGEEKKPKVLGLLGQPTDAMGGRRDIFPKIFNGSVGWTGHLVCTHEDMAYDPILAEPTELAAYLADAFTEPPVRGRAFHGEELDQLIADRPEIIRGTREVAPFIVVSDVGQLMDGDWPPLT